MSSLSNSTASLETKKDYQPF
ncbi:hypothetical protein OIU78_008759, partial [Salix suchowensis]